MAQAELKQRSVTPRRIKWGSVAPWLVLLIVAVIALWPMYWLYVTAFTPTTFSLKTPPDFFPVHANISNFQRLLSQATDYWSWGANSLTISIVITLFHLLFDTMAGYAFAKRKFPGRTILFWVVIGTMMIPTYVTLVPMYLITQQLNLIDSLWAVILPGFANVFGIFLMRQYIQTLPTELLDAARIDGCGEMGVFWHVILPLCRPAVGALAIFTFVQHWNDFLWPLIVLQSSNHYTLSVGVASLQGEFTTDYGIIFAGAALAALPMIIFFLIFQRNFLSGVRMGAIKG
ncbi:sugar ABC transporter permease [Ktedonobacter sp. SOSP1-52]|uniref:carbohydrate ABC transporter permease n=1 Tax=Ktedonobacter sp. SOSP1-52 TaxID=2778366 RepID=UPI001915055A|nr:carbohydrate ABC transporter permease [Ktedonobacter sp. SOSP1-52]GHO65308.1 sugar ABC transporter permease [Ktedonobacter sp. SOSP1-52]